MQRAIQGLPFVRFEHHAARLIRLPPGCIGQPQQAPGHNQIGRQRPLATTDVLQLQVFEPTPTLEDEMVAFDQPAITVPADSAQRIFQRGDRQAGHQQPT